MRLKLGNVENGKIKLNNEEHLLFMKNFKKGLALQLHKEGLFTDEQLKELFKAFDK